VATLEVPYTPGQTVNFFAQIIASETSTVGLNDPITNPAGLGSIAIHNVGPNCGTAQNPINTTPKKFGPNNNSGTSTSTFGLQATGSVPPDVTAIFDLSNVSGSVHLTSMMLNAQAGIVSTVFDVPRTSDTFTVSLILTDVDGNKCSSDISVALDLTAPVVTITTPSKPDSGNSAVLNLTDVVANVTKGGAAFSCTGCANLSRNGASFATGDVVNGVVTFSGVMFPSSGTFTVQVTVTDAVGNAGSDSETIDVTINTCPVDFLTPSTMTPGACPKTIFGSNLVNGSYPISFSSLSCIGHTARLSVTGPTTATANGTVGANGIFGPNSIPLQGGTYMVHGEVDNTVGSPSSGNCVLTVDTSKPAILSPAPPGPVTINFFGDADTMTAGAQRSINFSANLTSMTAHADLCTTQQVDPATGTTRAACPDGAAGWYLAASNLRVPTVGNPTVTTFSEGSYSVKIVVVDGTATNASDPVALVVDVTRPCVSSGGLLFDRDNGAGNATYGGDFHINIAENAQSALATLSFAPGCGDSTTTLSASSVVVQQVIGAGAPTPLPANVTQTVTVAGGRFNVVLGGLTGDSAFRLVVSISDAAGNPSVYTGTTDPASHQINFDFAPTTCLFVAPAGTTPLNTPQVAVHVTTDPDVSTAGVKLTTIGPAPATTTQTQTQTPVASEVLTTFPVTDGAYTMTAACTDPYGNATTSSVNYSIDLTPPQNCTLVSPSATGGPLSNGVYPSGSIASTFTATGANGQKVTFSSNLGGTVTTAFLTNNTASDPTSTYNPGTQTITATVADAAGNTCTATALITVSGCGVAVKTNVAAPNNVLYGSGYLNRSNTTPTGASTGTVGFIATGCPNEQLTLTRTTPGGFTAIVQTTDASGVTTFPVQNINDGEVWTIANGLGTTRTMTVDLVAPTVTGFAVSSGVCPGNAPTCNSTDSTPLTGTSLFFVAAAGNRLASTGKAGYFADGSSSQGGAQMQAIVRGISGASGGTVDLLFGSNSYGSTAGPATTGDVSLGTLSLPEAPSQAFALRVTDIGGNVTNAFSGTATVDVTPPPDPAGNASAPSTRGGQLTVAWSAVTDNQSAVTYEIGWTTSTMSASGIPDEPTYFTPSAVQLLPQLGSATSAVLNMPPITTYSVVVRAIDGVGNYSLFVAMNVLSVPNLWSTITLTDTTAASNFGQTVVSADVVGGAGKDLVVGAPGTATTAVGAIYVFTGGTTLASVTCPAGCTAIAPPDGQAGQFGADISVDGNVTDLGSPNDIVVSQPRWSASTGRVFIFAGTTGASISTAAGQYVEIRGNSGNTFFGQSVKTLNDIDGDGFDDVAISTPTWDVLNTDVTRKNVGRIYIFKGRKMTDWQTLMTNNGGFVPVALADYVIDGPTRRCNVAGTQCGNAYGTNRFGMVNLGKVGGANGSNYFGIPMSRGYWSTEQLWNGATVAATPFANDAGVQSSAAVSSISQNAFDTNAVNGFGFAAAAGSIIDLNGAGSNGFDLAVTAPQSNSLFIYGDMLTTGFGGTAPKVITGPNSFGAAVAVGDLTDDQLTDVVSSEFGTLPTAAWIAVQVADAGFPAALPAAQSTALRGTGSSAQGASLSIGNFTGHTDTKNDLAVGDYALQTVKIWK
jgi:hypothetical protein